MLALACGRNVSLFKVFGNSSHFGHPNAAALPFESQPSWVTFDLRSQTLRLLTHAFGKQHTSREWKGFHGSAIAGWKVTSLALAAILTSQAN